MKSGNILLGLFACAALCACTDNDIGENGGNGSQVFEGDVAYMVVNIKEVGTAATKATSTGFSTGTENAVNDIHFYFYDEEGNLVTVSTPDWSDGTAGTEGENIEYTGKKVVVLHDLAEKIYPSYMVTVINQPSGFGSPQTLEAMQKALVDASDVCGTTYFTMSTSSYFDEETDSKHDTYYFATPVSEDNFSTQPIDEDSEYFQNNVVSTYVERLAAKVLLKNAIENGQTGSSLPWYSSGTTDLPDSGGRSITIPGTMERSASTRDIYVDLGSSGVTTDSTYYTITAAIYDVTDDGTISSSDQDLYIHFDNWALNATAKQSYMVKNIDSNWDSSDWTGWSIKDVDDNSYWNDTSNKRSYWGMSYNYNSTDYTYPTSSSEIKETDCLNYIAAKDITNYVDGYAIAYCAENTNTAGGDDGIIQSKNSSAITSILVQATVYNKGGKPLDLVRFDSELYTKDAYLTLALKTITEAHPIYVGPNFTTPLSTSYLGLKDTGDGYVKVYIKGGSDDEETGNDDNYYDANNEKIEDSQALIDEQFNNIYGKYANGYFNGQMYYNVPIEHLNDSTDDLEEANYGVVRNHYYVVTLNNVSGLGRGITDTDDPIIPQEEQELYYLGAEVQILSWREVNQGVDLN